jgi:biopolymer transport protein ExbB
MIAEMLDPTLWWAQLQAFLQQGGSVLVLILATTFFLWMLVLERYDFFWRRQTGFNQKIINHWHKRDDKESWFALQTRERWYSLAKIQAHRNLSNINLIVAIAPLLGLLGTVTGMVGVFDVMAITGASNARAMAEGVSKATIPTMAGMVVSLLGVFFSTTLQRRASASLEQLSRQQSPQSEG